MPLWPYQDKTQPSQPQHSLANSFFHPCVSVEGSLNVWAPNPPVRTHVGQVVYDCELQGSNARKCFGVTVLALAVVCYAAVQAVSSSLRF